MKNFSGIHPTALIGDGVKIGENVTIGAHCIVYDNVEIGDCCQIGADVILGEPTGAIYRDRANYVNPPLVLGEASIIRSGSILYAGSTILGGETVVGRNSIIGGNVWLTESVAPFSVVYHKSQIVVRDANNFREPINFII